MTGTRTQQMVLRGAREIRGQLDHLTYRTGLRSSDRLRLPGFLGIGAQKAGTTWLHANLSCHPELFLPTEKEIHYFDWFEKTSLRSYARVFSDAGARMAGDISPGYSAMTRRRVRMVHRVVPEARIVLLLRDPVERAWSQVLMAMRRADRDPGSMSVDDLVALTRSRGARRRGDYTRMISDWTSVFGSDRLWIGFYDDIALRPFELLAEVFRHLGVDTPTSWTDFPVAERFNPGSGSPPRRDLRAALDEQFEAELDALESVCPAQVALWRAARPTGADDG